MNAAALAARPPFDYLQAVFALRRRDREVLAAALASAQRQWAPMQGLIDRATVQHRAFALSLAPMARALGAVGRPPSPPWAPAVSAAAGDVPEPLPAVAPPDAATQARDLRDLAATLREAADQADRLAASLSA
jgi:hypothetical protein